MALFDDGLEFLNLTFCVFLAIVYNNQDAEVTTQKKRGEGDKNKTKQNKTKVLACALCKQTTNKHTQLRRTGYAGEKEAAKSI